MVFGYLDDHNRQPIRVSYLHLAQPPWLVSRRFDYLDPGISELTPYGVDVSHL
jgi:hypothetical protein